MLASADIIALVFVAIVCIVAAIILFAPARKSGQATAGGGCFLAVAFIVLLLGAIGLIAFYWNR